MTRSFKHLWNIGHIGYFYLFNYLLAQTVALKNRPLPQQWMILLLISLVIGVVIELLQYGILRNPDIQDVIRDMLGCLLFTAFYPRYRQLLKKNWYRGAQSAVLLLLLLQFNPLIKSVIDEMTAWKQFPVLASFETPYELERWGGNSKKEIVKKVEINDSHVMSINLSTDRYSGAGLNYFPSDFSSYKYLKMRFYNPADEPLKLTFRMHDSKHTLGYRRYAHTDRYHKYFQLKHGWNDLEIDLKQVQLAPTKRQMDMTDIRDISFFANRLKKERTIYIDDVLLF